MQDKRKGRINWSSAIGWLIFILVIAGGPLMNFLRGALGGAVPLPTYLVPLLIGGLVGLSILVSVVRAIVSSSRASGDTRLPTSSTAPRMPNAPMPPFGDPPDQLRPNVPRTITPPAGGTPRLPAPPRFEPIVNPAILTLGVLGLLVLAGAALLIFGLPLL